MNETLKTKGRPAGGKNLALISLSQLREKLTDTAKIPISIKFAKQMGLAGEEETVCQQQAQSEQPQEKVKVSFSVSEDF